MNPFNPPLPSDAYQTQYWSDAHGSARSLAIAQAASEAPGPLVVICENNESVEIEHLDKSTVNDHSNHRRGSRTAGQVDTNISLHVYKFNVYMFRRE